MSSSPATQRLSPLILVALQAIGPAIGLGIARFAHALILPTTKQDMGWTFSMSGTINTINASGYLAGALLSGWMSARWSPRAVFSIGVACTILSIPGIGLFAGFVLISTAGIIAISQSDIMQ